MALSRLYVPGESVIHSLTPQMKILVSLMVSSAVLLTRNIIWISFVLIVSVVYFLLAKIPLKVVKLIFYMAFTGTISYTIAWWVFAVTINRGVVLYYGVFFGWIVNLTSERFTIGLAMSLRIIIMVILGMTWLTTTTQMDTIVGLRKFRLPYGLCLILALTLRLVPTMSNELHIIYEANQVRGVSFSGKNIGKSVKAILGLFVPLITCALRSIINIGNALDSRGFKSQLNPKRTYIKDFKLGRIDYIVFTIFFLISITTVIGAFLGWLDVFYW